MSLKILKALFYSIILVFFYDVVYATNFDEVTKRVIKEGKELASEGLKMEKLRVSDKSMECGTKMRALQKRVDTLLNLVDDIKPGIESKYSFVKRYSGTNPKRCVSCISSAASTCARVINEIDEIEKEFDKLK